MSEELSVVLALIDAHWDEIHHLENQRSALTNILLVIEAACLTLIFSDSARAEPLVFEVLLGLCGTLGILATAKYYERFRYSQNRLTELYRHADALCPRAEVLNTLRRADLKHRADRSGGWLGRLAQGPLRLHRIWSFVHAIFLVCSLLLLSGVFGLSRSSALNAQLPAFHRPAPAFTADTMTAGTSGGEIRPQRINRTR
jgi:hypothetical protein